MDGWMADLVDLPGLPQWQISLTSRAFHNDALGEYEEFITNYFGYDKVCGWTVGGLWVDCGWVCGWVTLTHQRERHQRRACARAHTLAAGSSDEHGRRGGRDGHQTRSEVGL